MDQAVISSLLDGAVVVESAPGRVALGFRASFDAEEAARPASIAALRTAAERAFGGSYAVTVTGAHERAQRESPAARRQQADSDRQRQQHAAIAADGRIRAVIEAFDGTLDAVLTEAEALESAARRKKPS
jgi:hypothetical protein